MFFVVFYLIPCVSILIVAGIVRAVVNRSFLLFLPLVLIAFCPIINLVAFIVMLWCGGKIAKWIKT